MEYLATPKTTLCLVSCILYVYCNVSGLLANNLL